MIFFLFLEYKTLENRFEKTNKQKKVKKKILKIEEETKPINKFNNKPFRIGYFMIFT